MLQAKRYIALGGGTRGASQLQVQAATRELSTLFYTDTSAKWKHK